MTFSFGQKVINGSLVRAEAPLPWNNKWIQGFVTELKPSETWNRIMAPLIRAICPSQGRPQHALPHP
jgi:hypothetical protein